ncbi:MAG TPA: hypothetical protein VJG67_00855 [Candidatus Paceibacterota bacterium]
MQSPLFSLPALPDIDLSLFINKPVFVAILVFFFVIYTIISSVLMYHWSSYGMRSAGVVIGETIFVLVSLALFTVAGLAINYF